MQPIPIFTVESRLKRRVRNHLHRLGFKRSDDGSLLQNFDDKSTIREVHRIQRLHCLQKNKVLIESKFTNFIEHFASGPDIQPAKISPRLEPIRGGTWQSELFRFAALTWSIPVSQGFGRRMRFLVWDDHNEKLIGLIALGDPVFNLRARDDEIGWSSDDRRARLVNVLDAYVLGALPPYNMLLGGKLISCLIRTQEVKSEFRRRYARTEGIISKKQKNSQLVMVTTSSALGRSSVYNRLVLDGQKYFVSKGMTQGWGHFHIPDKLFLDLREYLKTLDHPYADGHIFGKGPNWRLRTIRAAFDALGFRADLLRHGVKREFFVSELASNAKEVLTGRCKRARYDSLLDLDKVCSLALDRWVIPRAERRPEYRLWKNDDIKILLKPKTRLSKSEIEAAR